MKWKPEITSKEVWGYEYTHVYIYIHMYLWASGVCRVNWVYRCYGFMESIGFMGFVGCMGLIECTRHIGYTGFLGSREGSTGVARQDFKIRRTFWESLQQGLETPQSSRLFWLAIQRDLQ